MERIGPEIEQALAVRLAELTASHAAAFELVKSDHSREIGEKEESHLSQLESLKAQHAADLVSASDRHASTLDETSSNLASQHRSAFEELRVAHEQSITEMRKGHAKQMEDLIAERESLQRNVEDGQELLLSEKRIAQTSAFEDAKQVSFEVSAYPCHRLRLSLWRSCSATRGSS